MVEKVIKRTCMLLIGLLAILTLSLVGGFALPIGNFLYKACEMIYRFSWLFCGITFVVLILTLVAWFFGLVLRIARGDLTMGRQKELAPEHKNRFPTVWVIVAMTLFLLMSFVINVLYTAGKQ